MLAFDFTKLKMLTIFVDSCVIGGRPIRLPLPAPMATISHEFSAAPAALFVSAAFPLVADWLLRPMLLDLRQAFGMFNRFILLGLRYLLLLLQRQEVT